MVVACVNIPRFAVEAERQRRKRMNARLVLIGENTVYDCSLGAEVLKVRRGMKMSEAIGLCPTAIVLPTDVPYYERRSDEVVDFAEAFSPVVEASGTGAAYVALDGLPTPPRRLADDVIAGIHKQFGFMASVGIASGKFAARVAALITRPGVVKLVADGTEAAFLAPLPIEHLPAAEAMRWRLAMLGMGTIGEVARLPPGAIQAQFGAEGRRCWELAQGFDSEPVIARVSEQTIVRRLQLPSPAMTMDVILAGTEKVVQAAYSSLGGAGRGRWVRKAVVRAVLDGGGTWELPVAFREAVSDGDDAWFAIRNAITKRPPERPVEEIEVELIGLSGESGKQARMFEGKGKLWRQVEEAVRQIEVQQPGTEKAPVGKIVALEPWSRIPERRAALAEFGDKLAP